MAAIEATQESRQTIVSSVQMVNSQSRLWLWDSFKMHEIAFSLRKISSSCQVEMSNFPHSQRSYLHILTYMAMNKVRYDLLLFQLFYFSLWWQKQLNPIPYLASLSRDSPPNIWLSNSNNSQPSQLKRGDRGLMKTFTAHRVNPEPFYRRHEITRNRQHNSGTLTTTPLRSGPNPGRRTSCGKTVYSGV